MTSYTDPSPAIPQEQLEAIAVKVAQAVVAGLPRQTGGDEPSLSPAIRLANSLFSELRFALGSSDTVNGKAKQLLPISVTEVDAQGKGKIRYKREKLLGLGAKSLTVAYRAGQPQTANVPSEGDEIVVSLEKANAVAVTLWDDENAKGARILVSFVTYQ